MFVDRLNTPFKFSAFTSVAFAIALTVGCSSTTTSSDGGNNGITSKVSELSEHEIRSGVQEGMTKGMTSNLDSIAKVFDNSAAMSSLSGLFPNDSATTRSLRAINNDEDDFFDGFDEILGVVGDLADHSNVTNISGDIVTMAPIASDICPDAVISMEMSANTCTAVLGRITLETDVDTIVAGEVIDATVEVKFDQATFLVVDFSLTSLSYEVRLAGLKTFFAGVAQIEGEIPDLPGTMTGAVKLTATVTGDETGAITLSIPVAIQVSDVSSQVNFNVAATPRLFELTVDGVAETVDFEIGINPIDLLFTDEDSAGSFPVHLTLDGLSGKMQLNGTTEVLTVTGATLNSLTVQVNSIDAFTAALSELDFSLDGSGNEAVITLSKVLDFDLMMKNLRGFFADDSQSMNANMETTASFDAPTGTVLTVLTDDVTKVTGGDLSIVVNSTEGDLNLQVTDGLCLDDSGEEPEVVACPSSI